MKKPFAILYSLFAIAALAAAQTAAIQIDRTDGSIAGPATIDWSATTGLTITWPTFPEASIPAAITRDTEVDGYFADPSTNGSFSASTWRSDLGLGGTFVRALDANTSLQDFTSAGANTVWIARGSGFGALLDDGVALANPQMVINASGSTLIIQSDGAPADSGQIGIWRSAVVNYNGSTVSISETLIPPNSVSGLLTMLNAKQPLDADLVTYAADPTAAVTAAGALMDSEVTNLAAVKAFDPTAYEPLGVAAADITDATATGQAAITAADAAALRDVAGATSGVFPVATLPTQTTITDTDSSVPTSGAVVDYVTAAAALKSAYEVNGVYTDGAQSGLKIIENHDIGTSDATLVLPALVLDDWTPVAETVIYDDYDTEGIRVILRTDGTIRLTINDGANGASVDSTAAISLDGYTAAQISVAIDRDTDITFYVNGNQLGAAVANTTAQTDITSGVDVDFIDGVEGFATGLHMLYIGEALTAAEIATLYKSPDAWRMLTNQPDVVYDLSRPGFVKRDLVNDFSAAIMPEGAIDTRPAERFSFAASLSWSASSTSQAFFNAAALEREGWYIEYIFWEAEASNENFHLGYDTDADYYLADGAAGGSMSVPTLLENNINGSFTGEAIYAQPTDGAGTPEVITTTLYVTFSMLRFHDNQL